MASETSQIIERGVATLPDETWEQARRRMEIISPLAALEVVGHRAADAAALALGLSRRQVYVLIRRAREGSGLVTDLAPERSGAATDWTSVPDHSHRCIHALYIRDGGYTGSPVRRFSWSVLGAVTLR